MRRRLKVAALELYAERGYEQTTVAAIAVKAGVTERTFFRHFPDKREALFDGEGLLGDVLTNSIRNAPPALGPWDTLLRAFRSSTQLFIDNRSFSLRRHAVIAANPALAERELAKVRSLITSLATVLSERGISPIEANLAAQMGMAALTHAVALWFADDASDLDALMVRAFIDVRILASSGSASAK